MTLFIAFNFGMRLNYVRIRTLSQDLNGIVFKLDMLWVYGVVFEVSFLFVILLIRHTQLGVVMAMSAPASY